MSAEAQHAHNLGRMHLDMAGAMEALAAFLGTGSNQCAAQVRRQIRTLGMRIEAETRRLNELVMREQVQAARAEALNAAAVCSAGREG